jgi:hypothetical protein
MSSVRLICSRDGLVSLVDSTSNFAKLMNLVAIDIRLVLCDTSSRDGYLAKSLLCYPTKEEVMPK